MPDEGAPLSPSSSLLTPDELHRLATIFVTRGGVRKVRLTGGEPTIRKDLPEIIERLSSIPGRDGKGKGLESIGMTSNGIKLQRSLKELVQKGLTHLNISLDTLDEHKFEIMTRRRGKGSRSSSAKCSSPDLGCL